MASQDSHATRRPTGRYSEVGLGAPPWEYMKRMDGKINRNVLELRCAATLGATDESIQCLTAVMMRTDSDADCCLAPRAVTIRSKAPCVLRIFSFGGQQ